MDVHTYTHVSLEGLKLLLPYIAYLKSKYWMTYGLIIGMACNMAPFPGLLTLAALSTASNVLYVAPYVVTAGELAIAGTWLAAMTRNFA